MEKFILYIKQLKKFGPDHDKTFTVELSVNGEKMAIGEGRTKKEAEMEAAKVALEKLA